MSTLAEDIEQLRYHFPVNEWLSGFNAGIDQAVKVAELHAEEQTAAERAMVSDDLDQALVRRADNARRNGFPVSANEYERLRSVLRDVRNAAPD